MPQSGTSSSQSNKETGNYGRESTSDGTGIDRKIGGAVHDAIGNATGSLDGAAQEGSTAFILDGRVKGGLATHQRAVVNARSVGEGGSELDVFVEDIAGAGLAQLVSGKRGLDAKEDQVFALELIQVGDDHLLLGAAGVLVGTRAVGSSFENAVLSIVAFATDGLGHRIEGVENVVSADYVGIGGGGEFVGTGGVEVGELATDNTFWTTRDAWAETVQR